jgi:hypothetical protein
MASDQMEPPADKTPQQILEEQQRWAADAMLKIPAGMPITRDLFVLGAVHLTEDRKSDVPQGDLNTALLVAIAKLEKRVSALENAARRK